MRKTVERTLFWADKNKVMFNSGIELRGRGAGASIGFYHKTMAEVVE